MHTTYIHYLQAYRYIQYYEVPSRILQHQELFAVVQYMRTHSEHVDLGFSQNEDLPHQSMTAK